MTATTTPPTERLQRDDLVMFDLMHRAMRVEIRALADALWTLRPGDADGARQLQTWYGHVHQEIVVHHTVEDEIFFPGIVAIVADYAAVREELHEDHEHLDVLLVAMARALADLVAAEVHPREQAAAVAAARALADLLDEHLDAEEAATFPVMLDHVSKAEADAMEAAAFANANKKEFPFVGPWLLVNATPAEAQQLFDRAPKIVKVLYRLRWKRSYERRFPLIVAAERQWGR